MFLESDDDEVDGLEQFKKLKAKRRDDLRNRFDLWKRGNQHHKKYFHGFVMLPANLDSQGLVF